MYFFKLDFVRYLLTPSKNPSSKIFRSVDCAQAMEGVQLHVHVHSNNSVTSLAVCFGALSCLYMPPPSGYNV